MSKKNLTMLKDNSENAVGLSVANWNSVHTLEEVELLSEPLYFCSYHGVFTARLTSYGLKLTRSSTDIQLLLVFSLTGSLPFSLKSLQNSLILILPLKSFDHPY